MGPFTILGVRHKLTMDLMKAEMFGRFLNEAQRRLNPFSQRILDEFGFTDELRYFLEGPGHRDNQENETAEPHTIRRGNRDQSLISDSQEYLTSAFEFSKFALNSSDGPEK